MLALVLAGRMERMGDPGFSGFLDKTEFPEDTPKEKGGWWIWIFRIDWSYRMGL